ncbi:Translational activator of cytochrome c oxidase 1 [Chionoecetes opilio]|uniref:Translational activator of cytochrome c oxidase 1 n=1 Tax=Chionoecetes opilio TaxID=41210 RepID=A0A8J4Y3B6_CHIOP|nr:Translational activator of cytochrome c oxidase 1 [Chionoecetes opilio]
MSYFAQIARRVPLGVAARWCVSARPAFPAPPPAPAWCGAGRGMAGHNKWSNIRHGKALKDAQKQRTVGKCLQMIKLAIKEGGNADPKLNSQLARVIEFARTQNITATTITNTLKQSQIARRVPLGVAARWCVSARPAFPAPPPAWCGAGRGMAGHNKWSNIRHGKALKDAQKQRTVGKCLQMIKLAIKEGGSADPKLNSQLARVIEFARTQNITATTITNTLKQSQKTQDNAKSMRLEYRAPGGLLMMVEVFTDSLMKTRAKLQTVIKKTRLQEARGSTGHVFEEKGVVVGEAGQGMKMPSLEEALELAIEIGAEEVEEEEGEGGRRFVFTCSPEAFLDVKKGIEVKGYLVTYANTDFLAKVTISLPQDEMERLGTVIEKLEAHDEGLACFTTNLRALVRVPAMAVGVQLTQLFIIPFCDGG